MRQNTPRGKILLIGPTPPPFQGVAVLTHSLLQSSLSDNFSLFHLDTSDRRPMSKAERLNLGNVYLALLHGFKCLWTLFWHRPDVVYVPISQGALGFLRDSLFMVPARWFGAKLVVHLHGGAFDLFYDNASPLTKIMLRFCMRRVDVGIVLCEKFRGIFGDLLPPERVVIIENGLPDEFGDREPSSFLFANDKLRVVYLGTMMQSKGFVDLVHSAPTVLQQFPNVKFVLVGDGSGFPEFVSAQAWVTEHGLKEHVEFVGPKWGEDKKQLLLSSDIFCFPRRAPSEGQPLVILEAMAAGLPLVTTRYAADESTLGEKGALYAKANDPEDLAAQLITLLRDQALRAEIGLRNRQRFLTRYTMECFAQNLGRVFYEVLGVKHAAPILTRQAKADWQ